jgi:hypothetical protein
MPWRTMGREEQRTQFVVRATSRKESMAALCREFGISRPTGYLWQQQNVRVERFDGKLLVSYRHMYVREVDFERGCSRPLVVARDRGAENAPVAPSAQEKQPQQNAEV